MCGILAIIGKGKDVELVKSLSKRMSHRGPDESDMHSTENGHILSHERLSIIDLHSGKQPIQGCSSAWMVHNGEIYNHLELRRRHFRQSAREELDEWIAPELRRIDLQMGHDIDDTHHLVPICLTKLQLSVYSRKHPRAI